MRAGAAERVALGTVVTYNHLHTALNLVRSIRATWREQPVIYIALIDQADRPRPGFAALTDCHVLPVEDLGLPDLTWLAMKFSAADLCCVAKPFLMQALLRRGHAQVYYSDSDMHFFCDPAALRAYRPDAELVTTPHLLGPIERAQRMHFPAMGHIATAGMMNAGLFRLRDTPGVRRFLANWGDLASGPGAFLPEYSGQSEQQAFNWVFSFLEGAVAFRDPLYNVAYWNLQDRPLRWAALDDGPADLWTLEGQPIVCFHFSGFEPISGRLSRHDHRHRTDRNVNLHGLGTFYVERLEASHAADYAVAPYRYAALAGDRLSNPLREELRRLEVRQAITMKDWEADGTRVLRLLNGDSGSQCALPRYLDRIVAHRTELAALSGAPDIFPHDFYLWLEKYLHQEYELSVAYDRYCPFAFERARLQSLSQEVAAHCPELTPDQASELLTGNRGSLLQRLEAQGDAPLVSLITGSNFRIPAYDAVVCLRRIYETRPDLQSHFPDPLGDDLIRFRAWLRDHLPREYILPSTITDETLQLDPEAAIAAVLGYCQRHDNLRALLRQQGFCHLLLRSQLPFVAFGIGVRLGDLVLAEWWLDGRSVEELTALQRVMPGSLSAADGESYRRWWLQRHSAKPWLRAPWHRRQQPLDDEALRACFAALDQGGASGSERSLAESLEAIRQSPDLADHPALAEQFQPTPDGINLFGYFRSPIGLGSLSRGLSAALQSAGCPVRQLLLTNATMEGRFGLDDLTPDFDFGAPRNLFVSYPHIDFDLFQVYPPEFFAGRESGVHLAWEQRDFHPAWGKRLVRFDRLFALSRFAADAVAAGTGRHCDVIPCVVSVDAAAAARFSRRDFDLPATAFVVGLVMDATSSLERKNPLGAVEALARAFAGQRDVVVALKISGGAEGRFQSTVRTIVERLAGAGLDYRLITGTLPKAKVEGLIRCCDAYLSLHRAEGFGYTIAEAMLLGVPVVASAYSGNMDFMSDDNAFAVPCRETLVTRQEGPFQLGTVWGDPDLDAAAALLRDVRDDPAAARAKAARAQVDVAALTSAEAVGRRLRQLFG